MRTTSLVAALVALSAAYGTNVEYVSRPAPAETADAGTAVLADQVTIDEIAVYQSVKVAIVMDGALAKPNAPLIAGRPALVRAHARSADRKSRKLAAELRVTRAGKEDLVLRTTPGPLPATVDDGDLDSTFNFKVEEGDLTTDAAISVRVAEAYDAPDAVTFPANGKGIALGAKDGSGTLRVKSVEGRYMTSLPGCRRRRTRRAILTAHNTLPLTSASAAAAAATMIRG